VRAPAGLPGDRLLCLALALSLASPAFGADRLPDKYPPFLLGPGDLLNITVYGEEGLPKAFLVDSSGTIVFPLVGELSLSGLTQAQASERLAQGLSQYQKGPQVTVQVTESAQYNVSILGNVARPGKYRIRGLPKLLSALAEAGGPLPNSALNKTVLVREDRVSPLLLGDYLADGSSAPQPLLYPGDVIYVPRSFWPSIGEWGIIMGIVTSGILIANSLQARR
jgi:polysaccharide export outer membrane protein